MKRIAIIVTLFPLLLFSQTLVRVNNIRTDVADTDFDDEAYYTPSDLVNKVLIPNGGCYNISNIEMSPNIAPPLTGVYTDTDRSYGYFEKGTSAFPFSRGVILSTGKANTVGNILNNGTLNSTLTTTSDANLQVASGMTGVMEDATYLKFDFQALGDEVKFRYILASEEYTNNFPCPVSSFFDVFALLIKPQGAPDSEYVNIALLPNGDVVSVRNIRPNNPSCIGSNVEFFQGVNAPSTWSGTLGVDPIAASTNLNGLTIPLTATYNVIPGQFYTFKFVIADIGDDAFNSAIFLEADFDIGLKLTDNENDEYDFDVATNRYIIKTCELNEPVNIRVEGGSNAFTYTWFYNNGSGLQSISGLNTNSATFTQPGIYRVSFNCNGTQIRRDFEIQYKGTNFNNAPYVMSQPCNVTFNLTNSNALVSSDTNFTSKFYTSLADAQAGTNEIVEPERSAYNPTTSPQTIISRIENSNGCIYYKEIQLTETGLEIPEITASATSFCDGSSVTLTSSVATNIEWSTGETTQTITVSASGTYTVSHIQGDCSVTSQPITITKIDVPVVSPIEDVSSCDSYILPSISIGNYYTESNGLGTMLNAGDVLTTSQTVYVYAQTGTTPNCTDEESFQVTILNKPVVDELPNVIVCDSYTLPNLTVGNYFTGSNGSGSQLTVGSAITSSQTIYIYANSGTSEIPCTDEHSFTVTVNSSPNAGNDATLALCINDSTVDLMSLLGSSAQSGGTWSPSLASGTGVFNPALDSAGTYTYTVAGTSPCLPDSAEVLVTINPNPNASISSVDTEVCSGDSGTQILFTGTSNTTVLYTINGGSNQSILLDNTGNATLSTGSLTADTTYTLVSASVGSCSNSISNQSITITVNPLPNASLSAGSNSLCYNESTTILFTGTPNADISYSINGGTIQTVTLDGTGNYTLSTGNLISDTTYTISQVVSNSTGCSKMLTQSVTITVLPLPTATIANNGPICVGSTGTVTITGTPNATVTFTIDSGSPQTITLSSSGTVSLTTSPLVTSFTYTLLKVVSTDDCEKILSESTVVTSIALPSLVSAVATDPEICSNQQTTIQLTGTPNSTVSYTINGGSTQTLVLDATGTYSLNTGLLSSTTTYHFTQIKEGNCTKTEDISVVISVVQAPSITGDFEICELETSQLQGSGTAASVNAWVSSDTSVATISDSGLVTAISNGTTQLTYTNSTGCSSVITFTVNELPNVNTSIAPYIVCDDNFDGNFTYDLNTINKEDIISNASLYTIRYYDNMTLSNEITSLSNYNLGTTLPVTLYVSVVNTATGCSAVTTISFIENTVTPLLSTSQTITECDEDQIPVNDGILTDGFDLTSVEANFNTDTSTTFEYYKTQLGAENQTAADLVANPSLFVNTTPNAQTIYVRIEQQALCAVVATIDLVVNPMPYSDLLEDPDPICEGQTDMVTLQVEPDIAVSFTWKDANGTIIGTSNSVQVNQVGTYTITMVNANGCTNTQSVTVESFPLPYIADIVHGNGTIEVIGAGGTPPYEYSFDGGMTWTYNNTFASDLSGSYVVGIRNAYSHCEGEDEIVPMIYFANTITPDGNHINEVWRIKGTEGFKQAKILIYDRYGKVIYTQQTERNMLTWDGKYQGRSLPQSTYWYKLEVIDDADKTTSITGYIVVKNR